MHFYILSFFWGGETGLSLCLHQHFSISYLFSAVFVTLLYYWLLLFFQKKNTKHIPILFSILYRLPSLCLIRQSLVSLSFVPNVTDYLMNIHSIYVQITVEQSYPQKYYPGDISRILASDFLTLFCVKYFLERRLLVWRLFSEDHCNGATVEQEFPFHP